MLRLCLLIFRIARDLMDKSSLGSKSRHGGLLCVAFMLDINAMILCFIVLNFERRPQASQVEFRSHHMRGSYVWTRCLTSMP
jgi:hypothetical protein